MAGSLEIEGLVIGEKLSETKSSRIFVAEDVVRGIDVALKLPFIHKKTVIKRFAREIMISQAVRHDHLIPFVDNGLCEDGQPYLTTKLAKSGSLKKLSDAPIYLRWQILQDSAIGVRALHHAGFLHRDVNPANIFIGEELKGYIGDLGIAKHMSDQHALKPDKPIASNENYITAVGIVAGTPAYCSPEQSSAQLLKPSTDIFSWGLTAVHILTGRHPWQPASMATNSCSQSYSTSAEMVIANNVLSKSPDLRFHAGVPDPIKALVTSCIEKEPNNRPAIDEIIQVEW